MGNLSGDISSLIFRRTLTALKGQVSMNGQMLKLMMLLDGHTDVSTAALEMGISMTDMRTLLNRLLEYRIIEEVHDPAEQLSSKFLGLMASRLSTIAGPIARVMVEDALLDLGDGPPGVPKSKASELIEVVGRQIPDEGQRREFIKQMLQELGNN